MRNALEAGGFVRGVIVDVGFAVDGEQHRAVGRMVLVQRAGNAPDIVARVGDTVVILDAAFQDERLLYLWVFVKGDVSAGFQP